MIADRVILVMDPRVDALVGLRDRIPPERALLRRVQPDAVEAELASVRPFPFAVAGVTRGGEVAFIPAALLALLTSRPIPIVWWGALPAGLPAHARQVERWDELRGGVVALLASAPAGVSLADHRGLRHGARVIQAPQLEGVLAAHPQPLVLAGGTVRSVRAALLRHRLPLRLVHPGPGLVGLEALAA